MDSALLEVLVGLAIAFGLFGVVVQVLPGSLIIVAAIAVWAVVTGGTAAWVVLAVAVVAVAASAIGKYVVAGAHLRREKVPGSAIVAGGVAAVIGFFVIPVVGLFVGFVGGVYLAERLRLGRHAEAWRATKVALRATGLTILIELAGAMVATGAWVVGLVVT